MADSLFDQRYRYDHIYPRGRSGETLRAVDTHDHDRPVVIKRPAPNDAPPIRAGQEVSILSERRALQRLAGHPVLTALLGGGQFAVGGIVHQYIVLERAEGVVIADEVLALAARGERLPELEMLVVIDGLLDLLTAAHAVEIVYNDVDAKHLFWDRAHYRLKVIDWGNAVFLEGDAMTAQGVSTSTDIAQVGELLYFIVTGGGRSASARAHGDEGALDFGDDARRLHSRLQAIIAKAAHPSPKGRYPTVGALRADLREYAAAYEKDRRLSLDRAAERLKRDLSRDELTALAASVEAVRALDPGFPRARELAAEIDGRMRDLDVAADLDAAHIYLESESWARAGALLAELRPRARGEAASLIALLSDWTALLAESTRTAAPPVVGRAIGLLFEDEPEEAALVLITDTGGGREALALQYLLAERISSHKPEVLLLRPNLYRFETALAALTARGLPTTTCETRLRDVYAVLDGLASPETASIAPLRDGYRTAVDRITVLIREAEALTVLRGLEPNALSLNTLTRALNAAMALTDNLHVIGRKAAASPREALAALDSSRQIAPGLPAWETVGRLLDGLYELLGAFQTYIPAADGSDLAAWLADAAASLSDPYMARLGDESLAAMARGFTEAAAAWDRYASAVVAGGRTRALAALEAAAAPLHTAAPALVVWLGQLHGIIASSSYIERHALAGPVGRALADGWEHFDRGRLSDAERLGLQAAEAARSSAEAAAAERLRGLAAITREWQERGGPADRARTEAVLARLEGDYTDEERAVRAQFAAQMPARETYLRAMNRGLVEALARLSSAAVRVQYSEFVLRAAFEAQRDTGATANAEAAEAGRFYREAALKTLGEAGLRHPLMRVLAEYIDQRRDQRAGAEALNALPGAGGAAAFARIDGVRRTLENSAEARTFGPAVFALRALESGAASWAEGDFRTAGLHFEGAVKALDALEADAHISVTPLRRWAADLMAEAAETAHLAHRLAEAVEALPAEPAAALRTLHSALVETTQRTIGEAAAGRMREWRDTYEQFAALQGDPTLRRSARLPRFTDLFAAQALDAHPAYPLYRHWFALTEAAPEFPAPPTAEPTPRMADGDGDGVPAAAPAAAPPAREPAPRRRRFPFALGVGVSVALAIGAAVALSSGGGGGDGDERGRADANATLAAIAFELSQTADFDATVAALPLTRTFALTPPTAAVADLGDPTPGDPTPIVLDPTPTGTPTDSAATAEPVAVLATVAPRGTEPTRTPRPPTNTPPPPTETPSPVPTETPSPRPTATFTPSRVPSATLPPGGLVGVQPLLEGAAASAVFTFDLPTAGTARTLADVFVPSSDGPFWRLGVGAAGAADAPPVVVYPEEAAFEARYGAEAAARIVRADAELTLATFNPALLVDDAVFFGFGLRDGEGRVTALEIAVVGPGIVNLVQRTGDVRTVVSQRADTVTGARIRLERSLSDDTLSLFYNGDRIGAPVAFTVDDAPVIPVVYAHEGVIVHVAAWSVTLR
jgi:hypothetical protein